MAVSAYWHGFHPGYYFSFITASFAMLLEPFLVDILTVCSGALPQGSIPFLCWLLQRHTFDYLAMGFLLLDAEATLQFWRSIGFCGHVTLLVIGVVGGLVRLVSPKRAFTRPPPVVTSDKRA